MLRSLENSDEPSAEYDATRLFPSDVTDGAFAVTVSYSQAGNECTAFVEDQMYSPQNLYKKSHEVISNFVDESGGLDALIRDTE